MEFNFFLAHPLLFPHPHPRLVLNFSNNPIANKHMYSASPKSYRLIEPFQKGETPTFIEHVKAGLAALVQRPDSLLVFSGSDFRNHPPPPFFKYRFFFLFSFFPLQ